MSALSSGSPAAAREEEAADDTPKPHRSTGLTEIRGSFHDVVGRYRLMVRFSFCELRQHASSLDAMCASSQPPGSVLRPH